MTKHLEALPDEVQSAECLRLLVEAAKDYAIFLLDPEGRVASWNQGAQALKGYTAAEILGRRFSVFYTAEDRERGVPERELKIAAMEGRLESEGWRTRKDGSRFWAGVVLTALRGSHNGVVGFAKVTRDLSERRAANLRFKLLEFAPDGVLVVDRQGIIVYANPRTRPLFGYDEQELLGRPLDDLVPARHRAGHPSLRARFHEAPSARSMGTATSTVSGLRKDGTEFPAEISLGPMAEGDSNLVVAFVRDTTPLRHLQAAQARAEAERSRASERVARLNTVAGALSAAIDLDAVAKVMTSAGLAAADAQSAVLARVVEGGRELELLGEVGNAPGRVEEAVAAIRAAGFATEVVRGRQRISVEARFPMEDVARTGSALWLRDPAAIQARYPALASMFARRGDRALACLPLTSRGGITGVLRLAFAEEHAFDSEERVFLTSFANQCGLALDRAHLYEEALAARDLAQRAALMRDEFLSIVVHDLGNPMNVVGLWATVISKEAPSGAAGEHVRDAAKMIAQSVERMALLLHDLGDVSSIDAGHLSIRKEERNLQPLVTETVDALAPLCVEKDLSIRGEAPSVAVSCDLGRVQQVLGNLVANAIKFTPNGGRITVEARPSEGGVLFSVADTGPGIAEEARAHVFERYWRGKARDVSTGVGLGLFISKGIVDAHGGKIWVEDAPGGGSRFCFTIPVLVAPAPVGR